MKKLSISVLALLLLSGCASLHPRLAPHKAPAPIVKQEAAPAPPAAAPAPAPAAPPRRRLKWFHNSKAAPPWLAMVRGEK